ncbi:hypothetical protein GCM10023196_011290 [Actinoallomurus vinaceus]|uniref:Uncharacterized protein n=1 Tax=Actinoallomurus vinaceus TaxID=1080074 RepID=A0ABP8U437_9ACTN
MTDATDAADAADARRIAAALRRSPVYVAPSFASAVPGPERLVEEIKRAPMPVFAVIVPLVPGGEWPDSGHLAEDVHHRLGRDGVYLTLDADSPGRIRAYEYGVDRDAIEAAGAVSLDRTMDSASLTDKLIRCVRLMATGQAHAAYQRQTEALNRGDGAQPKTPRRSGHGEALPYAVGGGAVVLSGVAALLLWRRRRMAQIHGPASRRPASRPAATTARSAAELREHATAELIRLGDSLEDARGDADLLQRALDAYAAAGKVLDTDRTVPGLAGALVLIDMGRDAYEAARKGKVLRPSPLCFFNPLHGDGPVPVRWRAVGGRDRIDVRACAACAKAVRDRETPDALIDGTIPYYEVDPRGSVWSATGYGQLRDDLVQRVLRGDLTSRVRNHPDH